MTQQSGIGGSPAGLYRAHLLRCASPVYLHHNRWRERRGRGGRGEESNPRSMLEDLVHLDSTLVSPDTPLRPCPGPGPARSSPSTEACSPICSMCCPTDADWVRAESPGPGARDQDPVSAAAHLHLLGESLFLIGLHLQETDKTVSPSSSLSLLLDSLLCALAPVFCLTAQVPELRSCTQRTLAATLENIAYVMPGL